MSNVSKLLVIVQFLCLTYLVFFVDNMGSGILLILQMLGFTLAIWSVFVMGIGRFNIQPEVKPQARLVTKGPYKAIRNPMYTGLLIFFGAGVSSTLNIADISVFILLLIVLLYKIILEEKYLSAKFGTPYDDYKQKSFRLFPYFF